MGTLRRAASCIELAPHCNPSNSQFEVGDTLRLKVYPTNVDSSPPHLANANILKCFLPFTMSQVVLVELDDPDPELRGQYVLKLFGRRFMSGSRKNMKQPEWSPRLEKLYRKYILERPLFEPILSDEESSPELSPTESEIEKIVEQARIEAHIQAQCDNMYETECDVYERLSDMQGEDVPRVIAHVELPEFYTSKDAWQPRNTTTSGNRFATVPGLLLQHIPNAFTLEDLHRQQDPSPAPRDTWQYIIDDAVRIIRLVAGRNIINLDVQLRNMLVRWDEASSQCKAFLIDLAQCNIRKEDVSDHEWRQLEAMYDNEGEIGEHLEANLRRDCGGGYTFVRSEYSERLLAEVEFEPDPDFEPFF